MTVQSGIIVADDDPVIRGILRSVLTSVGHDVFMTASGEEAVSVAARTHAALVMLDINMPRLNGLMGCQQIRALPLHAETPIAILTGQDNEEVRGMAARVGATTFITKPFQPAALLAALAPYLRAKQGSGRPSVSAAAGQSWFAGAQPAHALDRGKSMLDVYRSR